MGKKAETKRNKTQKDKEEDEEEDEEVDLCLFRVGISSRERIETGQGEICGRKASDCIVISTQLAAQLPRAK